MIHNHDAWGGAWSWGIGIRFTNYNYIIAVGEYLHVIDLQASTCWLPVLIFNIPDQDWLHVTTLYIHTHIDMGHGVVVVVLVIHWNPAKNKTEPKKNSAMLHLCTVFTFTVETNRNKKEIQQQLQAVRAFMVKPFEMNGEHGIIHHTEPGNQKGSW